MLKMEPVKRSQLTSQVIERIKEYIQANRLEAGVQLPGERELTRALGVSRNVTREAIRALQATGILDVRPGNGVFVADFDYGEIASHMNFALSRRETEFRHWLQARIVLEEGILQVVVKMITPEQISELGAIVGRMEQTESYEDVALADMAFHHKLAQITGNPVLVEMMSFLTRFFKEGEQLRGSQFGGAEDHRKILEALKQRDGQEAGRLMKEHINLWNI
ncbi:MAG: FadR family transcriptional regulator [Phycisphaerales bacterium]|jgi:GntR family transcriptional repressor for pyruvate dehydrogenase complex|nr:FadR family transcriptional regulator [Phycisphaerales bacterium]